MLAKKYSFKETEEKWINYWQDNKVYAFKRDDNKTVYSIDTPPPTVNGKIHIGHIFSYNQADMLARYKRLRGFNVFYPFGFDDNGLPSERLVEKELSLRAHEISREEFRKHCYDITDKYEKEFKTLFTKSGISSDWNHSYKTVSEESIKISQKSFLDLYKKNLAYHKESPALWCNECRTSIAQAELETKSLKTLFNYINFTTLEDNETFTIATTRPELLPAIVAVFINPNDEKNKHLIGKTAVVPVVNRKVKILGDEKVAVDKGTGIVMCCTFGDQTDIEWWKKYNLELKNIFTEDGKIKESIKKYGGLKIKAAREEILKDLEEAKVLVKQEEIEHEVQVHERCGKEVEYSVMNQWFIDIINHKDELLEQGNKINWNPSYMQKRYEEWVKNIAWDWCISRQRYFGVHFPVWYKKDTLEVIVADEEDLPVNPLVDLPKGYKREEVIAENDVLDTWATSSVTPLINMRYGEKENYEDILRPMSLRTNSSDIIRTWDFYTIVKSFYHFKEIPWTDVMITGFVMASKGEKISKSKGNSKFDPIELIDNYSSDVVRYWTASGRLGTDITYSEETLLRAKKLINKIWNVSKFIEMHLEDFEDKEFDDYEYFDKYILQKYKELETQFISYLDHYEVGLALNALEKFFWNFCDNYIEIVKHRLYRPEEFGDLARYSGQKTVYTLLKKLLINFSIYFPFITEEIYQEIYHDKISVHKEELKEVEYNFNIEESDTLIDIISEVRGYKTVNNVSLKTVIKNFEISCSDDIKESINKALKDFKATLTIENIKFNIIDSSYKIENIELEKEVE